MPSVFLRFLTLACALCAVLACPEASAAAPLPPEHALTASRAPDGKVNLIIAEPVANRQYGIQSSLDLEEWTLMQVFTVGEPGVPFGFEVPVSGAPKRFYRAIYSDDPDADFDGDGTPNLLEGTISTTPWFADPDSDNDGISNAMEDAAGLDKTVADDPSPTLFEFASRTAKSATLMPQGWNSGYTDDPNQLRTFRGVGLSATKSHSSSETGKESNDFRTISIDRELVLPPVRYDEATRQPIYGEKLTYSYTAGRVFTTRTAAQSPLSWAGNPGAIASRNKWAGSNPVVHGYTWLYAPAVTNHTLTGERLLEGADPAVTVPEEAAGGSLRTWNSPSVGQGGYNEQSTPFTVTLPNGNTSARGDLPPAHIMTWPGTTVAQFTSVTDPGLTRLYTLKNRWTYSGLISEMNTLFEVPSFTEQRADETSATWDQTPGGTVTLQTHTFRLQKIPGTTGVGPATVTWEEMFVPADNPDTATNESLVLPEKRLRVLKLNTMQAQSAAASTTDYVLDPRVSNFTQLPGETIGNPRHGTTYVSNPTDISIAPAADIAGVIGDVVPSAKKGSVVKHFVTPKKSASVPGLSQDYVGLIATGIDASSFDQVCQWYSDEGIIYQGATANQVSVSRAVPGRTIVRLKSKHSGQTLSEMHVWIVWCTPTAQQVKLESPSLVFRDRDNLTTKPNEWWVMPKKSLVYFEFTINPLSIISGSEQPLLSGRKTTSPPGDPGGEDSGAANKWDISRRFRIKHVNPSPTTIEREQIWGSSKYNAAANSMSASFPSQSLELFPYPSNPVEGNDDRGSNAQDNNPYIKRNPGLDGGPAAAKGTLASYDEPNSPYLWKDAGSTGETMTTKVHFGEFIRLEIGVGTTAKWYRVSDYLNWKTEKKFLKTSSGVIDDGSVTLFDNSGY